MDNKNVEMWRAVKGFEGLYEVSDMGRVKSVERTCKHWRGGVRRIKEKILKPIKHSDGYLQVDLSKNGVKKQYLAHRLVAEAFIPNPDNLPQVNHKIEGDEGKLINTIENLEWCDIPYNLNFGTCQERKAKARSKTVYQYDKKTHELVKEWCSIHEIRRQTGFSCSHISACCLGQRKSAHGFVWSYTLL